MKITYKLQARDIKPGLILKDIQRFRIIKNFHNDQYHCLNENGSVIVFSEKNAKDMAELCNKNLLVPEHPDPSMKKTILWENDRCFCAL